MDSARLTDWEPLFAKAVQIIDAATSVVGAFPWSFGGGTALMRTYRHRYSKDIDIFVADPQLIGHLTPRLSPTAEALTDQYEEGGEFVKLRFPEGEIDFVGTGWLTASPYRVEQILGRAVTVETAAEIVAKKVRYRADTFKARDLFDLAIVFDRSPEELRSIRPILQDHKAAITSRIRRSRASLEEEFAALDLLVEGVTFEDCVKSFMRATA